MNAPSVSLARLSLASALLGTAEHQVIQRRLENGSDATWTLTLPATQEATAGTLDVVDTGSGRTVGRLARAGDRVELGPKSINIIYLKSRGGSLRMRLRLSDERGTFLEFSAVEENEGYVMRDQASRVARSLTGPFIEVHDGDLLITPERLRAFPA